MSSFSSIAFVNPYPLKQQQALAMFALVSSGMIWGISWWPLKFFSAAGLDGHAIALTAYAVVAIFALPIIWLERGYWRNEWQLLILIGFFFGLANLLFTSALMMGAVVRGMLLFFLLPAWGVLGGKLILKERLGMRRLFAACLCLLGVFIIMGGVQVFVEPLSLADLAALIAGLCYTLAGICNRVAQRIPLASRTLISFVGCATIAVFGLGLHTPMIPAMPMMNWIGLGLFACIWLMGGTALTTYGVTHVAASRAAVLQVMELLVAVVSAVLLGGETLHTEEYIGGALILSATLIEAFSSSEEVHV